MIHWFKKKWLITLIGLIALSLIVWFVGPLIAIADKAILASVTSRVVIIAILFLLWILSNLHISIQTRRQVKQFSQDLEDNANDSIESEAKKADSDTDELAMLKMHFAETLQSLKDTQWGGKDGVRNLYEQPWYVIIGAPGSGKTTALINSGLNFPLAKTTGNESISGIGGTRFCEWLITDDAVLIDTAGRYTTQDSDAKVDASGWLDFLSLLKKHRKQRAVNGVLITVSMQDILQQSNDEKNFQIKSIQKRLQELNKQLGVQVPVYFLLTKCDLINGFSEFFGELSQEERKQVLGITFPEETIRDQELNIKTAFLPEYDNLIASVNQRLVSRLHEEKQMELKGQLLAFPQQMAVVREQLNDFIVALFSATRFYQKVMLRGVYFSSGAQKGAPIDQINDYFSSTFGLENQRKTNKAEKEHSFFLYDLLKNVIFKESGLSGSNPKLEKKLKWLRMASYAGIASLCLLAIFLWTMSYLGNNSRVNDVDSLMASFYVEAKPLKAKQNHYQERATLPALKSLYKASRVYGIDKDDVPVDIQYGLYQGDKLLAVEDAYFQQLSQLFIPAVGRRLIQQMNEHKNDLDYLYQVLKTYLMLGMPDKLDKAFVHEWMLYDWQQRYPSKKNVQELTVHLDNALGRLDPIELDHNLVKQVRQILQEVPLAKQIYRQLKQGADGMGTAYTFENNVGKQLNNTFVGTDTSIPWLYTKDGYQNYFQKNSLSYIKDYLKDDWVLGTSLKDLKISDFKSFYNEVEALYMEDYINYWQTALTNVKVKQFKSLNDLAGLLNYITSKQGPFKSVLADSKDNTLLPKIKLPSLGDVNNAMEKMDDLDLLDVLPASQSANAHKLKTIVSRANKVSELNKKETVKQKNLVEEHFAPIHQVFDADETNTALIGQVQIELTELLNLLKRINSSDDTNEAIFIQVKKYLQGDGFNSKLKLLAERSPEPLKSWIMEISASVWSIALENTRNYLNEAYLANVYSFYQERLINRYPLFRHEKEDIMLSDFVTFFKPGGIEEAFFKDYIKPFVYIKGDTWRVREIGKQLNLSEEYFEQLKRAKLVREVFFKNGNNLDVRFSIKVNDLSRQVQKFGFDLDEQKSLFKAKNLIKIEKYHWPSESSSEKTVVYVLIKVKGQIKSRNKIGIKRFGPWSIFRMLDRLKVEPVNNSNTLSIEAEFEGYRAKFALKPDTNSVLNPFSNDLLKKYRCLEKI